MLQRLKESGQPYSILLLRQATRQRVLGRPQLRLRGPFELDAVHRVPTESWDDLHSAHGLVHPRRTSLEGDDFSSASTAVLPKVQRQDNTLGRPLSITSGVTLKCCSSGNSVCPDTVDSATLGGRVASAVGAVSVFAVLLGLH